MEKLTWQSEPDVGRKMWSVQVTVKQHYVAAGYVH